MTDITRYTPLKRIVSMFLDQQDKSIGDWDKCWLMAFRALSVMKFAATAEVKTVRLPVNGNLTVTLPSDYISWSKIGVMNNNGEIAALKINNQLTTFRDNNPNRLEALTPDVNNGFGLSTFPYFVNYYGGNGYYCAPLFGLGSGLIQYSECRVDEKNGVIILAPDYPFPDLMLEYISCPERDEDYQIETCLVEAVIAFIEWKMKLNTEQNFYARFTEGRRSLPNKRVTLQELNQAIRQNTGFKIKA
jgi:hypothetical protein